MFSLVFVLLFLIAVDRTLGQDDETTMEPAEYDEPEEKKGANLQ